MAVGRSAAERANVLDQACAGDQLLREEIASLLAHEKPATDFIEESAFEVVSRLFDDQTTAEFERHIGSYRLISEIGRGGMGVVYLAERDDDQFQKRVAIKLIRRGMDLDIVLRRFQTERQILASLDHPNIARLIDGGVTEDERPYFIMEFVAGLPIDKYFNERKLSTEQRLDLFLRVCAAVQFAHQSLVIHRDIKPGNILVTREGVPKLLDFGIAKVLDPSQSAGSTEATITELRMMTPDYASPEQLRGQQVTTATDVYSLGVLLYELLTGQRPYKIDSSAPFGIAQAVCSQEPEKPSTAVRRVNAVADEQTTDDHNSPRNSSEMGAARALGRRLSGDLDNIVLMAMRKEPERRYSSVGQFAEDLRRHLDGRPVIARKDTFAYRTTKFVSRNKLSAGAGILVLISLVAGIITTTWQARRARAEALFASEQLNRARIESKKSEQISQFLQNTLGFADPGWFSPSQGKGPNATIGEALDYASQRAEKELANQPEVLASVLFTIGTAYRNLAQFDLAEQYLRKSLDLSRKTQANDSQIAEILNGLGAVIGLRGRYDEAEPLLQEALQLNERGFANGLIPAATLVGSLDTVGIMKVTAGHPVEGEHYLRDAIKLLPQLKGSDRINAAIVYANLGQARVAQGDFQEAESLYQSSINEYRQLPGGERLELATCLTYLGDVLRIEHKYDEAEKVLREALDQSKRLAGDNSPNLSIASGTLAMVLYSKGEYTEAEIDVEKALQIGKAFLPKGHLGLTAPMITLGLILNKTGRSMQAEAMLREALATREHVLPKGHWQIAYAKGTLGECLLTQRRYAEAEPLLTESYNELRTSQGDQNPRTQEARERLVELYKLWKRTDKVSVSRHGRERFQGSCCAETQRTVSRAISNSSSVGIT